MIPPTAAATATATATATAAIDVAAHSPISQLQVAK